MINRARAFKPIQKPSLFKTVQYCMDDRCLMVMTKVQRIRYDFMKSFSAFAEEEEKKYQVSFDDEKDWHPSSWNAEE